MRLSGALLCSDCETIFSMRQAGLTVEPADPRAPLGNGTAHEQRACPACGSRTFWPLVKFITDATGKVRRKRRVRVHELAKG